MPPERERRRQNPVACHMCRARKLKCDLRQPCSSCTSRQWACEYANRQDTLACQACRAKKIRCDRKQPCSNCASRQCLCDYSAIAPRLDGSLDQSSQGSTDNSVATEARLAKLERAVFGDGHQATSSVQDKISANVPLSPSLPENEERQDLASRIWLEQVCSGVVAVPQQDCSNATFAVRTTGQLADAIHQPRSVKCILVPPLEFALRVIDLFEEGLESAQQVMHIPTLRVKVQHLYQQGPRQINTSNHGLLALILAMSAHIGLWDTYQKNGLFNNVQTGVRASTVLAQQAMDAINIARDSTAASMEAVQAATILIFLRYHMEGFSMRVRMLQSTAVTLARELGLHMIDATQHDTESPDQQTLIDRETGRKLWWYITCTDWLLAFDSGPTEGVYSIVPQQMRVKKPRNLSADDLCNQKSDFERPDDEPSNMAYFLLRIKLAEVCRKAVDSMLMHDPEATPYDKVYELDAKFAALTASLPRFLQLHVSAESLKLEFGDKPNIQIGLQRALSNLMISVRRCKFHLPFLIRFKTNSRYGFSRYACLESAQKLLEVRRVFLDDRVWPISSTLPLLGLYRFVFYAAMVLVMDLCINNPQDLTRRHEVRAALRVVEETEGFDRTAGKLLQALRDVLSRHGIVLREESPVTVDPATHAFQEPVQFSFNESNDNHLPLTTTSAAPTFDFSEFEMLWPENLVNDLFLDPHCWDGLINLDTRAF